MPVKSTWTRILIGGFDFSGDSNSLKLDMVAQSVNYSVFQEPAVQSLPGVPAVKLTHNGYFSGGAANGMADKMADLLGVEVTVGMILDTQSAIPVGYILPSTYNGQLTIDAKADNLITLAGLWLVLISQLYRGYQLWAGVVSATGLKTGVDFGAAGAAGGKAWLFVHSIVGTATNASITVRTDDNAPMSSSTVRGTFTFSNAAAYEVDLATVERYMRADVVSMGGATSFDVTVVAAAAGVTY